MQVSEVYRGTHFTEILTILQSDPANTGPETRFRLQQTGQYIMLESVAQAKTHIGVLADGSLKSALITGKELDAQFGVRLIVSNISCKLVF